MFIDMSIDRRQCAVKGADCEVFTRCIDLPDGTVACPSCAELQTFDPAVGTGAALVEFYFWCADLAAELGNDRLADEFWQLGAQAAHPNS
jgi:hypothetical protein